MFRGVKNFFKKLGKNDEKFTKRNTVKSKKLPKNFANLVLDKELIIDSGTFDIDTVNSLMELYSVSNIFFCDNFIYFIYRMLWNTILV